MPEVEPLRLRPSLRAAALEKLREAIILGRLPPGHLTSEQAIANQLAISRTPTREALLQLEHEGLVEFLPNRGFRVTQPTAEHLADVYALRASLEGYAAMLLARRDDRQQAVARLERRLDEQAQIIELADQPRWVRANMDFHIDLVEAAGNPLMTEAVRNVSSHGMRIGYSINEAVRERMRQSLSEHRQIVDAIRAGQPEEAFQCVEAHLVITTALMRDHMKTKRED